MTISPDTLKSKGFSFYGQARVLPTTKDGRIAMDAAIPLVTAPNTTVPQMFETYIDPQAIDVLTAPRNATKIFPEAKKADWKDARTQYRMNEFVGMTTAYSDFGRGVTTDVNQSWEYRDIHFFQTFINVGDREQEVAAAAKINLLSDKQRAAAEVIEIDANKFYLYGVANKKIYGLLNDPNLPAAISPINVGTESASKTAWADKTPVQIYNDVLALFNSIAQASAGLVDFSTPMVLVLPPSIMGLIAGVTDFGVAPVMESLRKYFPNIQFEALPQLEDEEGVCTAMLVVKQLAGKPVGTFAFAEKLRTFRVMLEHSSMSQKWASSTSGFILYQPIGIARMTGIQKS